MYVYILFIFVRKHTSAHTHNIFIKNRLKRRVVERRTARAPICLYYTDLLIISVRSIGVRPPTDHGLSSISKLKRAARVPSAHNRSPPQRDERTRQTQSPGTAPVRSDKRVSCVCALSTGAHARTPSKCALELCNTPRSEIPTAPPNPRTLHAHAYHVHIYTPARDFAMNY